MQDLYVCVVFGPFELRITGELCNGDQGWPGAILGKLTAGREIASQRRLKHTQQVRTSKSQTVEKSHAFLLFTTLPLFASLGIFRLFGTFGLLVFLGTFRPVRTFFNLWTFGLDARLGMKLGTRCFPGLSSQLYISIHIYTYLYSHIYIYVHIYIHIYICIHIYIHIYSYKHIRINIHAYACIHTYIYIYIHTCVRMFSASRHLSEHITRLKS